MGTLVVRDRLMSEQLVPDRGMGRIDGRFFRNNNRALPSGEQQMVIHLYSQIEEITVPFRFENVPLPSVEKKPKSR